MAEPAGVLRHRGTRALQRLIELAPATGGLALWVSHRDLPGAASPDGAAGASEQAAPVVTDGLTLLYAEAFEQLSLDRQVGWVAHEVLHIALRHPQRGQALQGLLGDLDRQLFNLCADAIVNSALGHLAWLALPPGPRLEELVASALGKQTTAEAALLAWDVEGLYQAIDDRRMPAPQATRRSGQPDASGALEAAPAPGREDGPRAARVRAFAAPQQADLLPGGPRAGQPQDEAEALREWGERLQRAHAADGAHSMLRALLADLPSPRVPWEQVLRTQLARGLSTRPAESWSRPSRSYLANQGRAGPHRRMPWEPGWGGPRRVPRLVVVVDVSGSIADPLLARFSREIEALARRLEAALVLVIGDDQVRRVEAFDPGRARLQGLSFEGGGGTDFTPLLQEADRHRPDMGVVLTDLDGPVRFRPRWPVLWAVPQAAGRAVAAPFGRLLRLD